METSASLFPSAFLTGWIILFLASVCGESQELKMKPGQDVTLQCQAPRDASISQLEWSRPDLKKDGFVFFFRDGRSKYQHPSFVGRVQPRDPEMKDGDVSVILKNVTINDTGTYECRVGEKNTRRRERNEPEPSSIIKLKVEGLTAGHTWAGRNKDEHFVLAVGLPVFFLIVGIFGFVIFKKCQKTTKSQKDQRSSIQSQSQSEEPSECEAGTTITFNSEKV